MYWIKCIVLEGSAVLCNRGLSVDNATELNLAVLDLWSYFFQRHTLHTIINILGQSLAQYRESLLLECRPNET